MTPSASILLLVASAIVSPTKSLSPMEVENLFAERQALVHIGLPYKLRSGGGGGDNATTKTPSYLLDLYDVVERNASRTRTGAERDATRARKANVIEAFVENRTILEDDAFSPSPPPPPPRHHHHRTERFRFETPDLLDDKLVIGAELRLHREIARDGGAPSRGDHAHYEPLVLRLYQVVSKAGLRSLADAIYVNETNSRDDVLVFNVEDVVRSWIIYPETNHGLELEVELLDVSSNRSSPFVHPRAIGLKKFEGDSNREALLVIFSSEEGQEVMEMDPVERSRRRRQVNDNDDGGIPLHLPSTPVSSSNVAELHSGCKLRSFYVRFDDIGYDHILAPPGFYANYCSGSCPRFLSSVMNSTNHAWLQNLLHWLGDGDVPSLACVPTDYRPITLLYKVGDSFKFKKHDLVAQACGCR